MKLHYPAIFLKEDDGRYLVSFSDVPEAITCGNDFENIDIVYDLKSSQYEKIEFGGRDDA